MQATGAQSQQASVNLKGMEAKLYIAARQGSFQEMSKISNWKEQETITKNNVLHLHLRQPALKGTHLGILKPVVHRKFIQKVLEDSEGYSLLWKQNSNDDTPLHSAARFGHENAVQAFLQRAALVNQHEVTKLMKVTNSNKDTALHEAARAGHAGVVKLLVEADPRCPHHDPNEQFETPLYLAAESGSTTSVLNIIQTCGANAINLAYKGPCGRTALHAAVHWGKPEMMREMLEKDISLLKIQDDEGLTPLHSAAAERYKVKHLKVLLEYDMKNKESSAVYIQDKMGRTPLHISMLRLNMKAINSLLLARPDCSEIVDDKRQNLVHYAAKWTCVGLLIWMLRSSSSAFFETLFNEKDVDGNTPLHVLANSIPSTPVLHDCFYRLYYLRKSYPSLDLKALIFNKQNFTVGDILLSSGSLLDKEGISAAYLFRRGKRMNTYESDVEIDKAVIGHEPGEWDAESIKKASESRLVVATLLATASFTAGFTVPGGLNQDSGQEMGAAVFKNRSSFMLFMVSDIVAFTCSTIAILFYFQLIACQAKISIRSFSVAAMVMNIVSIGALMVAFLIGVSLVSSISLNVLIGISLPFIFYYCCLAHRAIRSAMHYYIDHDTTYLSPYVHR